MFAVATAAREITRRRLVGCISAFRGSTEATSSASGAIRNLNLHEYPSMELMKEHGIRTPRAFLASDPTEARELFRRNFAQDNGKQFRPAFLKAQVLSGGKQSCSFDNGFEGCVRLVSDPEEAFEFSEQMIGHRLLTKQVPEGIPCKQVMLVENIQLERELYLSILMDRNSQGPLLIGSASGGSFLREAGRSVFDRSTIASLALRPDAIVSTEHIDIVDGLEIDQCERMAENLGLDAGTAAFDQTVETMLKLYSLFVERDCTMIEVHPLGEERQSGEIVAVNTRVQFDDNAFFRQEGIFAQRDWDQQDPREAKAKREGIDYIGLDGSIGCMVNGAGLAMATMDLIHSRGGKPSNFLDVGGGANQHQVQTALAILEADPRVKVILVNIFGGLMRCDVIANGILSVSREIGIKTPMVLRLQGTNYEDAKALIAKECGMYGDIRLVDDLDEATELAVNIAEGIVSSSVDEMATPMNESELDDDPLELSALVGDSDELIAVATNAEAHKERSIPRFEGFSL
eukprot:CAMPEP_0116150506 /NCGR_PEP_ID=MMETSP0329-20121206/19585_1 /TAXON_ID=697910 /ORGANISM="Pseudo-nitzschia arenysensis, Strain B593" /LENGTH=516 /DNA_ID=CAMNT_0003647027 /DNA_START=166 /DNA_END=1716 /DNA_ORIENTATION=-